MAKKKVKPANIGAVGVSVAQAQASAMPSAWADRYKFDPELQQVVAKDGGTVPAMFNYMQFDPGSGLAQLPILATARSCMPFIGSNNNEYDAEYFALWESVLNAADGRGEMRKARRYYKRDPIVGKSIDMLASLANSAFSMSCKDDTSRETVDNWRKQAMPFSFMQAWFVEYFTTGMVPSLKTFIDYVPRDYRSNKIPQTTEEGNIETQAAASQQQAQEAKTEQLVAEGIKNREAFFEAQRLCVQARAQVEQKLCTPERLQKMEALALAAQYKWHKGQIPAMYTIIDPLSIEIKGPKEMGVLRVPFMKVSEELKQAVMNPNVGNGSVVLALPVELSNQIRNGKDEVWLSPNICSITYGKKQPHEVYPTPLCTHAFVALEMKDELIAMDRATARSVKNRILLVTLGNDNFPMFDQTKITEVQAMFNTPGKTMTLVWNHCIELKWIEPQLESLKDTEKYKFWNSEIRTAFGISPVLTGTSETSGAIGNSVMNFKGVEEVVTEAQNKFLEFFHKELRMLKTALGISADVEGKFDALNMKDEVKFFAVLTQAVMNGIIDHETALETLRFNFPTIEQRMEKMKKLKAKGLFMPIPSANNLGPAGQTLPAKGGVPTGGKPAGSSLADNNKNKSGKSQAKGLKAKASIVPVNSEKLAVVVDVEDLDQDHRDDVAQWFKCPSDWVMTTAEFKDRHGDIDITPPWPSLTPAETVGVIRSAAKLIQQIDEQAEKAVAQYKVENKDAGKRGVYVTSKVKDELVSAAMTQVLDGYLKAEDGEALPNTWAKHLAESVKEIRDTYGDATEVENYVAGYAMTVARMKKWKKKPKVSAY